MTFQCLDKLGKKNLINDLEKSLKLVLRSWKYFQIFYLEIRYPDSQTGNKIIHLWNISQKKSILPNVFENSVKHVRKNTKFGKLLWYRHKQIYEMTKVKRGNDKFEFLFEFKFNMEDI